MLERMTNVLLYLMEILLISQTLNACYIFLLNKLNCGSHLIVSSCKEPMPEKFDL